MGAAPSGRCNDMPESASSSELAPDEVSSLNKLISDLVILRIKEHKQCGEDKTPPLVSESQDDCLTHCAAVPVPTLNLDEATSPSIKKPAAKKEKKSKHNQDTPCSDALQRQAAQIAHWRAAQMSQWQAAQMQAVQVARWQAAQVQVAHMQAARVHQWR